MLKKKLEIIERELDKISLNKRLEIEAEHLKRIKKNRTLRLYIKPDKNSIKIYTRIIGEFKSDDNMNVWDLVKRFIVSANTYMEQTLNESEDCKNVSFEENKNKLYFENNQNENIRVSSEENKNEIEINEWTIESEANAFLVERKECCENYQIMIKMLNPMNIKKLKSKLAKIFNRGTDTLQNLIKEFYRYINANKLYDYNTSIVKCNKELKDAFNVEFLAFKDIGKYLNLMLEPIDYCVININLNKEEIWDIHTECDDLNQMPVLYPKIVQEIENKIVMNKITQKNINEKINILEEFIKDPLFFINRKIAIDSDIPGLQTGFYDDLNVQTAIFELIKYHEK